MKVTWEPEDIKTGQVFGKFCIKERQIIGYRTDVKSGWYEGKKYVTISLSDGMVSDEFSAEDLAKQLTEEDYVPVELLKDTK